MLNVDIIQKVVVDAATFWLQTPNRMAPLNGNKEALILLGATQEDLAQFRKVPPTAYNRAVTVITARIMAAREQRAQRSVHVSRTLDMSARVTNSSRPADIGMSPTV